MKSLDINLGTALPKLATILPLVVITSNVIVNIIQEKPFTNSEYVWSAVGLLASTYFGIFCKEIKM